jgi:hypothetical protein
MRVFRLKEFGQPALFVERLPKAMEPVVHQLKDA